MKPKIPQYMTNLKQNKAPFRFNENSDLNEAGEANTYNNIFAEATHLHGFDVVYIERTFHGEEPIFGEYLAATLDKGTPMRLKLEETAAWGGSGDMYSKFGLQVQDEATFYCPTITFSQAKFDEETQEFLPFYPKVSDLIYFVKGKKLFEIMHIENEAAPGFYVFGNRNSYVMKCKAYTFDHSDINMEDFNGIPEELKALDRVETVDDKEYDVLGKEEKTFNTPLQTKASTVIDNTEKDALF
jgi:Virus neck protein